MNFNDSTAIKGLLGRKNRKINTKTLVIAPRSRSTKAKESSSSTSLLWGTAADNLRSTTENTTNLSTTIETENRVIVAITEGSGEARCEIGMAVIDVGLPNLILCQISDSLSCLNTLRKINIFNPTDIIVPVTFLSNSGNMNRLAQMIMKQFPNVKVTGVPRKTFNKSNGMDSIKKLCLPEFDSIVIGLQHRYYALSAASALLLYLQNNLFVYFSAESIKIEYQESEGFTIIDVSTADRLELVSCTKPAQATKYSTLFGVLNHCYTPLGRRCLRSAILQPPYSLSLIEERFECTAELMRKPEKLLTLQAFLQTLPNIRNSLTITTISRYSTKKTEFEASKQLNYLLNLNSLVDVLEPLNEILAAYRGRFFARLREIVADRGFEEIKTKIRKMLHPAAKPAQGYKGMIQRCFAIKSGVNGFLDFVRDTYTKLIDEMREYVTNLGRKYGLALQLNNNYTKGYHLVLPLNKNQKRYMKKTDIPPEFIQVQRLAGSFTMKTMEIINYATRLEDLENEILKLSSMNIYELLVDMKQYIGLFYKLCEGIANLDMLQSLAQASSRESYTRPSFGTFTEIKNSRHPLLEFLFENPPVPNTISICEDYNLQIITGPNGSGKSIYIRQAMLLQIMAQVGCCVPASSAIFRPADRMFARVYLEDNMEMGASAFTLEMKEIKYILTTMTENSLFIIDELCRTTSLEQGTALAMALCEHLTQTKAYLFVTTHYSLITKLYDLYLNIKVWQMETYATGEHPREMKLDFKYKLIPGILSLKNYGICLLRNVWPDPAMELVYNEFDKIEISGQKSNFVKINKAVKLKYKLESDLKKLKTQKMLTTAELNKRLNWYQNELQRLGIQINSINLAIGGVRNYYASDCTYYSQDRLTEQRGDHIQESTSNFYFQPRSSECTLINKNQSRVRPASSSSSYQSRRLPATGCPRPYGNDTSLSPGQVYPEEFLELHMSDSSSRNSCQNRLRENVLQNSQQSSQSYKSLTSQQTTSSKYRSCTQSTVEDCKGRHSTAGSFGFTIPEVQRNTHTRREYQDEERSSSSSYWGPQSSHYSQISQNSQGYRITTGSRFDFKTPEVQRSTQTRRENKNVFVQHQDEEESTSSILQGSQNSLYSGTSTQTITPFINRSSQIPENNRKQNQNDNCFKIPTSRRFTFKTPEVQRNTQTRRENRNVFVHNQDEEESTSNILQGSQKSSYSGTPSQATPLMNRSLQIPENKKQQNQNDNCFKIPTSRRFKFKTPEVERNTQTGRENNNVFVRHEERSSSSTLSGPQRSQYSTTTIQTTPLMNRSSQLPEDDKGQNHNDENYRMYVEDYEKPESYPKCASTDVNRGDQTFEATERNPEYYDSTGFEEINTTQNEISRCSTNDRALQDAIDCYERENENQKDVPFRFDFSKAGEQRPSSSDNGAFGTKFGANQQRTDESTLQKKPPDQTPKRFIFENQDYGGFLGQQNKLSGSVFEPAFKKNDQNWANLKEDFPSTKDSSSDFAYKNIEEQHNFKLKETYTSKDKFLNLTTDIPISTGKIMDIRGRFDIMELASVVEDLECCSESIMDEDMFLNTTTEKPQHIIPIVKIIEGPDNVSLTFGSSQGSNKSITYSPLKEPVAESVISDTYYSIQNSSAYISASSEPQEQPLKRKQPDGLADDNDRKKFKTTLREAQGEFYQDENFLDNSISYSPTAEPARDDTSSDFYAIDYHSPEKQPPRQSANKLKRTSSNNLTLREIKEEFHQQDQKIYEDSTNSSDLSKYLQKLLNRPSAQQVKKTKNLAIASKNDIGVQVFDIPSPKEKKRNTLQRSASYTETVDMTLFSDKNAIKFDKFLNANPTSGQDEFNFRPGGCTVEGTTPWSASAYYEQNKGNVDNIVKKYLNRNANKFI